MDGFPIVRHPKPAARTPVLVSVPHYGTEPLPHITRDDYREPRFRQVGAASKKMEGTRLGLPLSRKFIELHGGKVSVKSGLGVGSTFTFTLPLHIEVRVRDRRRKTRPGQLSLRRNA